ncbi:acyltransferase [Amycolatopsis azurea]|uniref:acyltransferase n=1 Tax=Amycolatopsis azurea TaxID=36819 RepID=UPI003828D684
MRASENGVKVRDSSVPPAARLRATTERDRRFDRLRVLAAILVVGAHAGSFVINRAPAWSGAWWPATATVTMPRSAVPLFVMISGALLLRDMGHSSPQPMEARPIIASIRRRIGKIGWPLLFWSIVYLTLQIWTGAGDPRVTSGGVGGMIDAILLGKPMYHMYYLFITAGLYLATPFLRILVRGLAPTGVRLLAAGALLLASLSSLVDWRLGTEDANALSLFVSFIGYFLLGHSLVDARPVPRRGLWISAAVVASLGSWCAYLLAVAAGSASAITYLESFLDPLTVLAAVAVFAVATDRQQAPTTTQDGPATRLSGLTFGIYLVHPVFVAAIGTLLPQPEKMPGGLSVLAGLWISALVAASLFVMVAKRVPVLRHVV